MQDIILSTTVYKCEVLSTFIIKSSTTDGNTKDGNNTAADVSTRCSSLHQGNHTKHKAIMIFIYSAISPWEEVSSLLRMGCHLSPG